MIHIPTLRFGEEYESLDLQEIRDCRTSEVVALLSCVNDGIIRHDLTRQLVRARDALKKFKVEELVGIVQRAGKIFMEATLACGNVKQSPDDYIRLLSATSGLPHNICRANMATIFHAMDGMPETLNGLTRNLDLSALDNAYITQDGINISYVCHGNSLGVVLPGNSPGVNSLWLPAIALKVPVILKPGGEEPWTSLRLVQSLIAAGCPRDALAYYATTHDGADSILRYCEKGMIFGDEKTTARYSNSTNIEKHGPGYGKIIIAEDKIDQWPDYIDMLVTAVANNSGRACINASAILVPRHAEKIARAMAEKLVNYKPCAADDDSACLSAFASPVLADWIDETIRRDLEEPGAIDFVEEIRGSGRRLDYQGAVYLLPSVIHCETFEHPLANREFLYPHVSVTDISQNKMLEKIGPTLVLSVFTDDQLFLREVMASRSITRLNLNLPTTSVSRGQPHEGNLFEFLYARRAIVL